MEVVQPNFGIRIRILRLHKGWTQLDLADACNISEDHISNVERGMSWVGKQLIENLANALGVPQISLFDYSKNEEFVREGGLTRRAPRKPAMLIVRNKRKSDIQVP